MIHADVTSPTRKMVARGREDSSAYAMRHMCQKHQVFQEHSRHELEQLITTMVPLKMHVGAVLFRVGDQGRDMFVLLSGELPCSSH